MNGGWGRGGGGQVDLPPQEKLPSKSPALLGLSRPSFLETDHQVLHHERLKHHKNSMTGYFNTKILQNKFIDLKVILKYLSLG